MFNDLIDFAMYPFSVMTGITLIPMAAFLFCSVISFILWLMGSKR